VSSYLKEEKECSLFGSITVAALLLDFQL